MVFNHFCLRAPRCNFSKALYPKNLLVYNSSYAQSVINILNKLHNNNSNSVALVRERTIPTERPPLGGEVSANFADRGVSRSQHGRSPTAVFSNF
jgi:hypothetical protein